MDTVRQNKIIILMVMAVMVIGATLMLVSQEVYKAERNVKQMERDKQIVTWEIRSLNGELAYLTRPDRLDQLSNAVAGISPRPTLNAPLIITPVQFSDMRTHHVIPKHKPQDPRQTKISVPQTEKQKTFSSLLNTIGGDN